MTIFLSAFPSVSRLCFCFSPLFCILFRPLLFYVMPSEKRRRGVSNDHGLRSWGKNVWKTGKCVHTIVLFVSICIYMYESVAEKCTTSWLLPIPHFHSYMHSGLLQLLTNALTTDTSLTHHSCPPYCTPTPSPAGIQRRTAGGHWKRYFIQVLLAIGDISSTVQARTERKIWGVDWMSLCLSTSESTHSLTRQNRGAYWLTHLLTHSLTHSLSKNKPL